ncbi:MAG: hypothetical protein K2X29_02855 [Candidatus Obscuribacterales bacterium]|nr:hypothetical protein [Candidatus Obscuribacterales bacterium]
MKKMRKKPAKPAKAMISQEALVDTFQLRTALYMACMELCGGDMDKACEAAEYFYDNGTELLAKIDEADLEDDVDSKKTQEPKKARVQGSPEGTTGKLLKFRRKPDVERSEVAECFSLFAQGVDNGSLHSVFAIAITDKGAVPVVLVEPEDREAVMAAMNAELSLMFGSPHHVISDEDLDAFLREHNITLMDVLRFKKAQRES